MILKKVSELFDIGYGNGFELINMQEASDDDTRRVAFVSRTAKNNGISSYVKPLLEVEPFTPGLITVSVGGSVLETFLQGREFYTGFHVMVLTPKQEMSDKEKLFYCYCIRLNKYRYNYGRQGNKTLKDLLIPAELPSSWNISEPKKYNSIVKQPLVNKTVPLDISDWKYYTLQDIFDLKKGKRLTKENMTPGNTRFIGSSDMNNGLTALVGEHPIHSGNTISVCYNGSVAEAFYQPEPYWATDDVNVLYPKFELNSYIGIFIAAIIRREKYRYNYGRKWHLERMKDSLIKLPTKDNKPDWGFMETYIKSLPYSANL